jgi:hypothetical protein
MEIILKLQDQILSTARLILMLTKLKKSKKTHGKTLKSSEETLLPHNVKETF